MKKNYFLIIILLVLFLPNLTNNFSFTNQEINNEDTEVISIASENYLNLSYQNGKFYSWDQTDNEDQHVIGVFNTIDQSYLLDNFGVFWSLDYQLNKFYRITDQYGIAQIKYFQDEKKTEYINRSFVIKLENNKMTIVSAAILSENSDFTILNKNYVVASGVGLDLIQIDDAGALVGEVKTLIPPYDKGNSLTSFLAIDENSGIFIGDDQYFYLLKNITSTLTQTVIEIKTTSNVGNIVVINNTNVVLRDNENKLYFVDVAQESNIIINKWMDENNTNRISKTKNIAFVLSEDTFILNLTIANSSIEYGVPYLVKITEWNNLIEINNIKTISNFIFTNKDENRGVFLDKDLNANNFVYENDSFIVDTFGNLNSIQFANKDLIFGSIENTDLLVTSTPNRKWSVMKNVQFMPNSINTNGNLLNNIIVTNDEEINYQNTYFANGSSTISVTDERLIEVTIETDTNKRILQPARNNVTFNFSTFDKYKVTISFFSDDVTYDLIYQVNIINFVGKEFLHIFSSGTEPITYVGSSKDILYDIKSIDKESTFMINDYDYNYLQYVELVVYGDSKDMVVRNTYNLQSNSEIKISATDPNLFFGLKIVSLTNQINWIYLGFVQDGIGPMIDFWDTEKGQDLMNQALMHRYLERDLRVMNSQQIRDLIDSSFSWRSIAVQGKAIVISMISIFGISIIAIIATIIANAYLNKKIEIDEVEQNKMLKNTIDF